MAFNTMREKHSPLFARHCSLLRSHEKSESLFTPFFFFFFFLSTSQMDKYAAVMCFLALDIVSRIPPDSLPIGSRDLKDLEDAVFPQKTSCSLTIQENKKIDRFRKQDYGIYIL